MKTRIQKIIIMAVALLFLVAGVSIADDLKDSWHKPLGHAYGDYKKGYNYILFILPSDTPQYVVLDHL